MGGLDPDETAAVAAGVGSLKSDLGDGIRVALFGSRARRDHRADSDYDLLCIVPDGLAVDWSAVEDRACDAMALLGGMANVQFLAGSRMQDLYFDLPFLPSALRDQVDVTDLCSSRPFTA